jgi:hypothetical protein
MRSAKFKILELKGTASAPTIEIGREYSTREESLAAAEYAAIPFK